MQMIIRVFLAVVLFSSELTSESSHAVAGAALTADTNAVQTDLSAAQLVIRSGELPAAEKIAPVILAEEVSRRTGLKWEVATDSGTGRKVQILLAQLSELPTWKKLIPPAMIADPVLKRAEAYVIRTVAGTASQPARTIVLGADARGLMFGVGQLLRRMELLPGAATLPTDYQCATAPDRAIRGHQIGYRPRANSWDAWTVEQFDQYFRDMVVFGANCMENIPLQDSDPGPLLKYTRDEMNVHFSKLCERYDLDHWQWIPVEIPVEDTEKADAFLARQEALYRTCPRLDAVFVPGGDPGHNPCLPLVAYLERMSTVLQKYHPRAKIWLSLQGFKPGDVDDFYAWIVKSQPTWFGGVVMGPSSPPMEITRQRLPANYPLRWYPDITHIVRCQYPVPWLDPAWGITIGREGINPRPVDYAAIYHNDYRLTDGFLSYSDGIHDDFNKNLWTQLAWDPDQPVREIARDYARYFFRSDLGEIGADAILGLEDNLRGPAVTNGSVEGTWKLWQQLASSDSAHEEKWRLQMHLFRSCFDVYTRRRHIYENDLERQALKRLRQADVRGIAVVVSEAVEILSRAETQRVDDALLKQIEQLADQLFVRIGFQTSVPKYQASGHERGCMLDYVNYPLNNRWWLEDQLNAVLAMSSPEDQRRRIDVIVNWENPGPDGYYEVLGNVGRSPHMVRLTNAGDAMRHTRDLPMPTQRNIAPVRNSLRYAWHSYMDEFPPLHYNGLNPKGRYTVRLFAQRDSPLEIDGMPAKLLRKGDTYGPITEQEFEVPESALQDGVLNLTWTSLDQSHLNWREYHYVTDLWVMNHTQDGDASASPK